MEFATEDEIVIDCTPYFIAGLQHPESKWGCSLMVDTDGVLRCDDCSDEGAY